MQQRVQQLLAICEGNPQAIGGFPSQKANNAESVSTSWSHQCMNSSKVLDIHRLAQSPLLWMMVFHISGGKQWWKLWFHYDVIKWKHFPGHWSIVRGIHRSSVNSPHESQWCRALIFCLMCAWTNGWTNNRDAGDVRRHRVGYDVTVMCNQQRRLEQCSMDFFKFHLGCLNSDKLYYRCRCSRDI